MQYKNHSDHGLAPSPLRSPCDGWFAKCREPRSTSSGVPRQGSPPAYSRIETASPRKRRSKGLSCVRGNFHAQFLEGWAAARPPGYSGDCQARICEGLGVKFPGPTRRCARYMRRRSSGVFFVLAGVVSCAVGLANSGSEDERRSKPYPEDIPAARMVIDPYPVLNGIAVDPQNDVVIASDPNRKSLLFYDRTRGAMENAQTRPVCQIIGPATYIGMVASVVVDSQRQEIFAANNDIEDTVVVMPYTAKGNAAPRRVLSVPHQAWGLALGKSTDELAVTAEIFNAVVFYRREAKGVEAPVRVIRRPKTRLADPHGIYWDDANAEISVANHGNFRGVIHNTGADVLPALWGISRSQRNQKPTNPNRPNQMRQNQRRLKKAANFGRRPSPSFSANANDDQAPLRTIEGDATKLDWPMGIAEDSTHNTVVVSNNGDNSILIFDRQRGGNVPPVRIIRGERTGINRPMGLAVDAKKWRDLDLPIMATTPRWRSIAPPMATSRQNESSVAHPPVLPRQASAIPWRSRTTPSAARSWCPIE